MGIKVEVLTKEAIKPASPTPPNLKTFNLSILDHFPPPVYVPIIVFYPSTGHVDHNNVSERLKSSLSETLIRYYPLAGRVKDNIFIDCNDGGVGYCEARIDCEIKEFMVPDADLLHKLLPSHVLSNSLTKGELVCIQVNMFDCGGLAISVCISHKIADATTMVAFIKSWAATFSGSTKTICPSFDSASIFPIDVETPIVPETACRGVVKGEKLVTKRFVFEPAKITAARGKILATESSDNGPNKYRPTSRVEAVSALIAKAAIDVSRDKWVSESKPPPLYMVNHVVNMRKRIDPYLLDESFGNLLGLAKAPLNTMTWTKESNGLAELDEIVGQVREAISQVNGDHVKRIQNDNGFLKFIADDSIIVKNPEELEDFWMSSWCRLPLYEIDFGWGKPTWVTSCFSRVLYKNGIVLMDTKCGEGIEVWVNLEEEDMPKFELNLQDLLEVIS